MPPASPLASSSLQLPLVATNNEMKRSVGTHRQTILPLTSLRFFAAFYVVVLHTFRLAWHVEADSFANRFINLGFVSVSFFFILSGYILSVVYLRDGQAIAKRRFFEARFARIYPLFFVTLLADAPYLLFNRLNENGAMVGAAKTFLNFAVHVVMLHAWIPRMEGSIDPPNWSLSAEAFFYLVFPVLGVALWKLRGVWLWITTILLFCGGQSLVWVAGTYFSLTVVSYNPIFYLATFLLGILLARWQTLRAERRSMSSEPVWITNTALALAAIGFLVAVQVSSKIPFTNLTDGLLAPVFLCVIWALSGNESLISRLLSHRLLVVLGEASYGLYLIHFVVLNLFQHLGLMSRPAFYPVYLLLCIALSVLSLYYLETPSRKWLLNRFHNRSAAASKMASNQAVLARP
jgi:peptidoglycan/LPS O-acetylase OafA/YrhL